jgi:hypothetical protein
MIEHQIIHGREATVAYLTDAFEPATPDTATLGKVTFDDDGETLFLARAALSMALKRKNHDLLHFAKLQR